MNKCKHINEDGTSSIFIDTKRWYGIYPKKRKGICLICGKNFEFTEDEIEVNKDETII